MAIISLANVLTAISVVGKAVAATAEFRDRFEELLSSHSEADQDTLRDALADLMADNDEGHARLQAKLAAAAETS